MVLGAAVLSSVVYIFFWNGRMQNLDAQGAVGILIDIAILYWCSYLGGPPLNENRDA